MNTNLNPGDRVIATDSSGVKHEGYLDHMNACGQFYVMPTDSPRQPFYAFSGSLSPSLGRQPGFIDPGPGFEPTFEERQNIYIKHRKSNGNGI